VAQPIRASGLYPEPGRKIKTTEVYSNFVDVLRNPLSFDTDQLERLASDVLPRLGGRHPTSLPMLSDPVPAHDLVVGVTEPEAVEHEVERPALLLRDAVDGVLHGAHLFCVWGCPMSRPDQIRAHEIAELGGAPGRAC